MIDNRKSIFLKATKEGVNQLEAFVEEICDEYNIFNSYYSNIQLALNEAFSNACIHGNSGNEDSGVDIVFFSDNSGLHFLVKDQGNGFTYSQYEKDYISRCLESDINNDEGKRGLLLIRMLVDELKYHDNGSTIELIFYISSINYNLTLARRQQLEQYFNKAGILKT